MMSASAYLQNTASALLIRESEKESIRRSTATLRDRVSAYFGSKAKEQIQFGSSTRGTMLPRRADEQSDVDYMVVFDNSDDLRPATFIERLRKFAKKWYATSEIYRSAPTVVLRLNHLMFELVPAYRNWWTSLYIPAPASVLSDWVSTTPNDLNQTLDEKNKNNDYQIKPTIRLLKYWNARNGYVYNSYEFETWIAGNFFWASGSVRNYFFEGVRDMDLEWGAAQWRKDRVARAKSIVDETARLDAQGLRASAEGEIKKLIPPL